METEPQIVFEHVDSSGALKQLVGEELAKLEQFGRITAARVVISLPPATHYKTYLYTTKIHLMVPGGNEIAITLDPDSGRHTKDAAASVRDAFAAARRQLQDRFRVMDGAVKHHAGPEHLGRVARLFPEEGYGFIETGEGHEVFFTRGKVRHSAFDRLAPGAQVYFSETMGDDGPVAASVRPIAG